VTLTTLVAVLLGFPPEIGVAFGLFAMLGDTLSSFVKRRLGLVPSARATGLDQVPEAVLPLWLLHDSFGLTLLTGTLVVVLFVVLEIGLSKLLYWMHIRQQPY
jgi:CDP-2,3-bis-(O-geranylgeranyl)-sn-glycerol synthase